MSATARLALKMVLLSAIRFAAGPPQGESAPSGGSEDTKCRAWGPSCPPGQFGCFSDVARRGHRKQAVLLFLRNLQRADQPVQRFGRDRLAARDLLELLVGALHAEAAHHGLDR